MTGADVPFLPRGVRTHFDAVRQFDVLLGPERVLVLDQAQFVPFVSFAVQAFGGTLPYIAFAVALIAWLKGA